MRHFKLTIFICFLQNVSVACSQPLLCIYSEGEIASTVVLAEVLCAGVKEEVLSEDSGGMQTVDAQKLRPVSSGARVLVPLCFCGVFCTDF